jgi:hypothetical protein
MSDLFAHHIAEVKRYEGTITNHFHEPPLATLLAVSARGLMSSVDPVLLFLGLLGVALAALFVTVLRASPEGAPGVAFATAALLGSPTLLAIDRGHFFALICATLTIAASLQTLRGKASGWTILMFAIAVNLRPNAGIIPLALLLGRQGLSFRNAVILGITSVAMFVVTLAAVHLAYPAYTFERFVTGLREYAMAYGGELGFENGSSLYGMMRVSFGRAGWMTIPPFCVAASLLAPAILESRGRQLRQSEFVFLVLCAYVLGSPVFADYHLLVFVIPLILVAREHGPVDVNGWTIILASSLMLAPKNFVFEFYKTIPWSWQVIANPLILLAAAGIVLWTAWRRDSLFAKGGATEPAVAA